MSKRNKQKRNSPQQTNVMPHLAQGVAASQPTSALSVTSQSESLSTQVEQLADAASANITEEDREIVASVPAPAPGASLYELDELVRKASIAQQQFETQTTRLTQAQESLDEKMQRLDVERTAVTNEAASLKNEAEAQKRLQQELKTREGELLQREERLLKRECDADAGFAQRNREALDLLEVEARKLREQFSIHRSQIANERRAWEDELLKFRQELEAESSTSRTEQFNELDAKLNENKLEAARLRKMARELALDRVVLDEDRADFKNRVESLAAQELERREAQLVAVNDRLSAARADRDNLGKMLAEREEADRRFGHQTPDEVLQELRQLREERDQLRRSLGSRPGEAAIQRLGELERQREHWEGEQLHLNGKLAAMTQALSLSRIAVTEIESLRNHKAALEASNALLTKALQEEILKVQDMIRGQDGKSPFPSCSVMDKTSDLQATPPTTDNISDLKRFAEDLRHRMAQVPGTTKTLSYSHEDVRSFLAGLAMSRLHLLEGISGIGKTTLPLAFARAIGAGSTLIEVQAGWRDRQDLIGHFNAFERRFYESEFLLGLYRASSPKYRNRPFIVVLDEMNLSHPEQYFADLLSALEQNPDHQQLVLMTAPVEPSPALLDEGRILKLPPNVWFIGTANHDETTKDFADKTYDRSHVMELPRHPDPFEVEDRQPIKPVSLQALRQSFELAKDKHASDAKRAYEFLETGLADILDQRFRVGWGNRLQRQLEDYTPVVIAAGGSIGEATDHILATKLLRKIRDRHDNRPEDIIALRETVTSLWPSLDKEFSPKKSLAILRNELHRLDHDED